MNTDGFTCTFITTVKWNQKHQRSFIGVTCFIWTMVNITHCRYVKPMQYILVKGDVIEVNPFAIQLFHRVWCIWLKGQIKAAAFMTVFALLPEAIIQGWLLYRLRQLIGKLQFIHAILKISYSIVIALLEKLWVSTTVL